MQNNRDWADEQIGLIAKGSKSALAALYEKIRIPVYSYALSVMKSPQDAEDVLQDTLLEIWRSAGAYESRGKPMGWVISIAKSICLMKLRKQKARAEEPLESCPEPLAEAGGLDPEEIMALKGCFEELRDSEREIIVLHAVAGLKHREIAELLGLNLPTVLSRYNRSIKKLRKLLQ